MSDVHPLIPLSAAEITAASKAVQASFPSGTILRFKGVTLLEPPKAELQLSSRMGSFRREGVCQCLCQTHSMTFQQVYVFDYC